MNDEEPTIATLIATLKILEGRARGISEQIANLQADLRKLEFEAAAISRRYAAVRAFGKAECKSKPYIPHRCNKGR